MAVHAERDKHVRHDDRRVLLSLEHLLLGDGHQVGVQHQGVGHQGGEHMEAQRSCVCTVGV